MGTRVKILLDNRDYGIHIMQRCPFRWKNLTGEDAMILDFPAVLPPAVESRSIKATYGAMLAIYVYQPLLLGLFHNPPHIQNYLVISDKHDIARSSGCKTKFISQFMDVLRTYTRDVRGSFNLFIFVCHFSVFTVDMSAIRIRKKAKRQVNNAMYRLTWTGSSLYVIYPLSMLSCTWMKYDERLTIMHCISAYCVVVSNVVGLGTVGWDTDDL